jgi:uncharacterized protein (DUF2237 family)
MVHYSANPIILPGTTINSVIANNGCNSANNGSITVTAFSTAGPLQFSDDGGTTWNAGTSPYTFSSLAPGNYNIEVQDANQCTLSYSGNPVVIVNPPAVVISTVTTNNVVTCNGSASGSIIVTASGGTGALSFSDNGGTSYTVGTSPYTFSGLAPGSYSIKVQDANGCTKTWGTGAVPITQPATAVTISLVSSNNVSCNGGNNGSITVTASGGTGALQFSDNGGTTWNAGTSPYTFNGLTAGPYTIEVEDANGCTAIYTGNPVTLTQPAALTASAAPNTIICIGESYQLNGSGGGGTSPYSYAWLPTTGLDDAAIANPTASPTTTTTYTLTVTDANSCTANAAVAVTVNPLPSLSAALVGSDVVVSWPVTCTLSLYQNPNLADPGGWVADPNSVNTVSGVNYVTNAVSGTMFFRLQASTFSVSARPR